MTATSRPRAVVLCPGRGSYTESSLGSLPADHPWVAEAEELRAEILAGEDAPSLVELDGAERFRPALHLRPANVSPLIYLCSMLDAEAAKGTHDVVAVGGNSLGWYTALAVAGTVSFADGFRIVQQVSRLQEDAAKGGQIVYPRITDEWLVDEAKLHAIDDALESAGDEAQRSIELGGYAVLAGTPAGLKLLEASLPAVTMGRVTYPFRLAQHGPYHTPFVADVAVRAQALLADVPFDAPSCALIDGLGRVHAPSSTHVTLLRRYTLGEQITTPFDFTATVRTALREFAPDQLVLPGPGNTLGGVCGHVMLAEGWAGQRTRADFDARQAGDRAVLESMRRA